MSNIRQNWKKNMKFGENVKTATTRALKRRGGLVRDNLHNSPKRKALLRERLKRRDVRMWKIIVGDPRQTIAAGGACPPRHSKEFQKYWEPETKAPQRETLSAAA